MIAVRIENFDKYGALVSRDCVLGDPEQMWATVYDGGPDVYRSVWRDGNEFGSEDYSGSYTVYSWRG